MSQEDKPNGQSYVLDRIWEVKNETTKITGQLEGMKETFKLNFDKMSLEISTHNSSLKSTNERVESLHSLYTKNNGRLEDVEEKIKNIVPIVEQNDDFRKATVTTLGNIKFLVIGTGFLGTIVGAVVAGIIGKFFA